MCYPNMCIKTYIKSDARKFREKHPIKLIFQSEGENLLLNDIYIKELRMRNPRRRHMPKDYVPDDLEKINKVVDDTELDDINTYKNDKGLDILFNSINRAIHNQKEANSSPNYRIMIGYLSKLKKTVDGKKIDLETRLNLVRELLEEDNHFVNLTESLLSSTDAQKYYLLEKLVEFPLECMSSYIQGTTNSSAFLRRKYFDGQVRKRKDGSVYQRKHNILTEADIIKEGEDGEEFSPYEMVASYDKYFDNDIEDILSILNDDEKEVVLCLKYFSTFKKRATIREIVENTRFTKRQVETIDMKIKFKVLNWLQDRGLQDDYEHYYNLCKKYKGFEEKYEKFENKNVKKS